MPFAPVPVTTDDLISYLTEKHGETVGVPELLGASDHFGCSLATIKKRLKDQKSGVGKWNLSVVEKLEQTFQQSTMENLVPMVNKEYVPFGNFADVKKVIKSGQFYPCFITGLSGNGKTFSIEQACAQTNRELIRVNITIETDEDDLIGGFRLVNGETVWHDGPVVEALKRGAVLLLDEIDLASNKILCLQSVLEGNGIYLKKTGTYVRPAKGFQVFATANTKGKGSDDGRFIGTNVLNEAFLERFPVTFEQAYPSPATEAKILMKHCDDDKFISNLVDWADIIRKTFADGGIDEVISTRRLVHIAQAYRIFGDKVKAIKVCISRFDEETMKAFEELYDKVDADVDFEVQ